MDIHAPAEALTAIRSKLEQYAAKYDTELTQPSWALEGEAQDLSTEFFDPEKPVQTLAVTLGTPAIHLDVEAVLEEILLANKKRNPYASFSVFDTVMWEKIRHQENLTSYLNTNVDDVITDGNTIKGIICHQNTTETELTLYGKIFVDATGHGTLGSRRTCGAHLQRITKLSLGCGKVAGGYTSNSFSKPTIDEHTAHKQ